MDLKERILECYRSDNNIHFPDEVADELDVDLKECIKIIDELIREGKLEEADQGEKLCVVE